MFFVPALAVATGVVGAMNMYSADSKEKMARKLTSKNLNRIGDAHKAVYDEEQKAQKSIERLANRKYGVLQTSIKDFIKSYERLVNIEFQEADGIKELADVKRARKNLEGLKLISTRVASMVKMNSNEGIEFLAGMLTEGAGLLCTGSLIAVTVGSTITTGAIAVALNPMFLPASFVMATTGSISKDAERNIKAAQMQRKYVNIVVAQAESNVEVLKAIYERSDRLTKLLTNLNMLFVKAIKVTDDIIDKNGNNRLNYTYEEKEMIRNCLNFADAVKSILDTPLFESDGTIAKVSKQVLEKGEQYLAHTEQLMVS